MAKTARDSSPVLSGLTNRFVEIDDLQERLSSLHRLGRMDRKGVLAGLL
jgi:hypothetical protein